MWDRVKKNGRVSHLLYIKGVSLCNQLRCCTAKPIQDTRRSYSHANSSGSSTSGYISPQSSPVTGSALLSPLRHCSGHDILHWLRSFRSWADCKGISFDCSECLSCALCFVPETDIKDFDQINVWS